MDYTISFIHNDEWKQKNLTEKQVGYQRVGSATLSKGQQIFRSPNWGLCLYWKPNTRVCTFYWGLEEPASPLKKELNPYNVQIKHISTHL